jgi:hypothetical protein
MSEPQTKTDAEPTGGPWECDLELGAGDSFVWGPDGDAVAIMGARASAEEKKANARLIAAAGTAAQEAREMGYDPVAAVEMLPELLDNLGALAEINARWRNAESDDPKDMPEEDHEETFTRMESLLQMVNALASAEGSGE